MTKTTPPARIALAALLLSALALLGLYVDMGLRQSLLSPVWVYLFLYSVAFGYYIYAAARLVPNLSQWRGTMPLIFGFAVLFRLAVVFAPPSISTDIYRYVWDGRLILHGMNPYHYAPNAGPLRALRDSAVWIPMEYKAYQDIYMSMSQVFFGLGSFFFGESLTGFKLMYTTLDIGVMALLWRLLVSLKRPPALLVWYAWSPLPITEISLAGHQDVTGVLFLVLALLLVRRPRTLGWAGMVFAASILTKGFVLLLLPLFSRTFGRRFTIPALVSLGVLSLPMIMRLPEFLHGMNQYLRLVNVNSGLFHLTNYVLSRVTRWHDVIANRLCDIAILAAVFWSARRPIESYTDLLRRSFIVLSVTLLVVPTLFPWYLLWVLPFLCLLGRRPSWSFVLLTGLVVLLYTYYLHKRNFWWPPILEYVPFYALLWWEWHRLRQNQSRPNIVSLERETPRVPLEPFLEA
jgi:alpha-1,6-mannosyltransferase